jgi:hypothetical protein
MAKRLAGYAGDASELAELAAVSGQPVEHVRALAAASADEAAVVAFFNEVDAGTRAMLIGRTPDAAIFAVLGDSAEWSGFEDKVAHDHALKPPLPMADFHRVIDNHQRHAADLESFVAAWRTGLNGLASAIDTATGASGPVQVRELLATGSPDKLDAVTRVLGEHGFRDDHAAVQRVHAQMAQSRERAQVLEILKTDESRADWKRRFQNSELVRPDQMLLRLDDPRAVGVVNEPANRVKVADVDPARTWSREQLAAISTRIASEQTREGVDIAVHARLPPNGSRSLISGRQAFLMAISFVVCMVGIANAMLMAITERFREIATMKCLGATDRFILQQFLMEAAFQGFAGGIAGMLIGALLSLAKSSVIYGGYLFDYFTATGMLAAGGICIVSGVALSTLASIYPSWMASRMAPMDAMRLE